VGAQSYLKGIAIVTENNLMSVECVTDLGPYTNVGVQIFQKGIAIVMENNLMLLEFVEEVVRRI
jgi:hypothetical protein